jgi:class 3 adenylate cyclase
MACSFQFSPLRGRKQSHGVADRHRHWGTFTDVALVEEVTGGIAIVKLPTTPSDFGHAVIDGILQGLDANRIDPADVSLLAHATTVVTNALLENKGARAGFVTTRGMRDILELRRSSRADLYDLLQDAPAVLVPRRWRFEITERIDAQGEIVTPLAETELPALIEAIREAELQTVAVSFLFSFLNDAHERRVGEVLRSALPNVAAYLSSEVLPEIREFERASTTAVCAVVGPVLASYLNRLQGAVSRLGLPQLHVMGSSGGVFDIAEALRMPAMVVEYMGDGVLAYFSYPQAHEDDAERALRAGLALVEKIACLDTAGEKLAVRIGVATGVVVIGDLIGTGAAQERGVVCETPNLAARVQTHAAPGTLVIAESTRRQIGALFDLEDLGAVHLAGFAEPQRIWRVVGESGIISRFEGLRSEATPLVGRDEEIDLLLRRWQQVKAADGRAVLITGEPGIGKSRLTAALSQRIADEPHTRLRYFCSPHHQDSALHPFIVQLERAAGFARVDTAEAKLGKLWALVGPAALGGDEIELLAELLSLPNSAASLTPSAQRKRERLFGALLHQLEALARSQPVLMAFEDAHWIDPSSRELLDLMLDRISRMPVLLVITFRSEFRHSWSGQPYVSVLTLNRLVGRDGEELVERLAGKGGLSRETVEEIVARADGVPLFVEELTKAVLEAGERQGVTAVLPSSPPPGLAIPATLHASLTARFDRLGPLAKEVAQIGAVLGREFRYDLRNL